MYRQCFKASETLLGIETSCLTPSQSQLQSFKASETLLGIETNPKRRVRVRSVGFKASETLLGIETLTTRSNSAIQSRLQSLWNPFRDWNEWRDEKNGNVFRFKASETLLGIETNMLGKLAPNSKSFKASETLLGIETKQAQREDRQN